MCDSKINKERVWQTEFISEGLLTLKIDFMIKDQYVELRTSPMIFVERIISREACKNITVNY